MNAPAPSSLASGRIPELDGLRGVAIGMILIHHYLVMVPIRMGSALSYGLVPFRLAWTGVDLFFVLSGFLIGGILLDARESSNYFRAFYTRRFFRIVPIYALCLVASYILYALVRAGMAPNDSWAMKGSLPWAPFLVFLQNIWMMKLNNMGAYGIGVTWSLAIEEQFYLTLPLMIWILKPRKQFLTFLGAGILLAPILRIVVRVMRPGSFFPAFFVMMPWRADALLLGVLGAVIVRDARCRAWLSSHRRLFLLGLLILTIGLGVLTKISPVYYMTAMWTVGFTWLAAFYLAALLYALSWRDGLLARCLRWGWLGWLGSIAYGTYLFHQFFFCTIYGAFWAGPIRISSFQTAAVMLAAVATTLVFCRLSWTYFEKPLVQIGHRAKYEFAATPSAPLASVAPVEGN